MAETNHSPAEAIVRSFGGVRAMAAALTKALGKNVPPTTVQGWKDSGVIPARRQQAILDAARDLGIALSPADFFRVAPIASKSSKSGIAAPRRKVRGAA